MLGALKIVLGWCDTSQGRSRGRPDSYRDTDHNNNHNFKCTLAYFIQT